MKPHVRSAIVLTLVLSVPAVGILSAPAVGAPSVLPARGDGSDVDLLLRHRIHDPRIGTDVAMIVVDAQTGAVISEHDADRPMRAASNMKVVTAVNALALMGPRKRFVTRVLTGGTPADIILQGAGDPLLSATDLGRLARVAARSLIPGKRVVVHVDGDLFSPPRQGAGWTPGYQNYLIASVQALAMRGDRGKHPSADAAAVFASELRSLGFIVRIGGNEDAGVDAVPLAVSRGHTVAQAVAVMLRESESNVAEVLFRQTAIASGLPATWSGGVRAAIASLAALGVSIHNVRLFDGSGLSRRDRLTPRFLTDLLRVTRVLQPARFAAIFRPRAMPVAGRTGTLTTAYGRYDSSPSRCAQGYVQAKTGTLYDTIALSGVADTVTGGMRLFSVMVNDRPTRYSALATRIAVDGLAATIAGCWR